MDKNRLIVVTGGAGFIGSSVIACLNESGMKNIIVVDDLGLQDKWKNLVGKNFVDIVGKDQFFAWANGRESDISAFIHLGACSSTVETNANYLLENNTRFSMKLGEYALRNNQRFIYASSAATYGDGRLGFVDQMDIETLRPLNMYGFSKQLFDLWVKNQGHQNQLIGLKYFNVFGPNEGHKGRMASAIHHLYPIIKKTGKVHLFKSNEAKFTDGEQKRDFIYVKDAARMTCDFLNHDNASGLYNIGSGTASSWNALAKAMFKAMDRELNIEYMDMPADLIGKYQNYTCADMSKTKALLGHVANCSSLESSVADYIKNHLDR